jgi:hypothetical protein
MSKCLKNACYSSPQRYVFSPSFKVLKLQVRGGYLKWIIRERIRHKRIIHIQIGVNGMFVEANNHRLPNYPFLQFQV